MVFLGRLFLSLLGDCICLGLHFVFHLQWLAVPSKEMLGTVNIFTDWRWVNIHGKSCNCDPGRRQLSIPKWILGTAKPQTEPVSKMVCQLTRKSDRRRRRRLVRPIAKRGCPSEFAQVPRAARIAAGL
jgi:hypothetical protein